MRKTVALAALAGLVAFVPAVADAAVTITFAQVGTDVVATSSGTLDLAGLRMAGPSSAFPVVRPSTAVINTGVEGAATVSYTGLSGPTSFGTGGLTLGDAGTGTGFGINIGVAGGPYVFVPNGYVSNGAILSTATFNGATFASLGLSAGSYIYRSSANDTVTVNIPGVPEPTAWALVIGGIAAVGLVLRRRKVEGSLAPA